MNPAAEAAPVTTAATVAAGSSAARELRDGLAHAAAGRLDDAILCYRRGLADAQNAPARHDVPARIVAELHFKLGNAGMIGGDLDLAAENFKAALHFAPDLVPCWCNLGNVYQDRQQPQDAIALYMQALKRDPEHWPTRTNLAQALIATKQFAIARALLLELAAERPHDVHIHKQIGKLHADFHETDLAIARFARALALHPDDAESLYWLGGLHQTNGDHTAAQAAYRRAAHFQPLIRRSAQASPPAFAVLALFAPFAGNTPTEFLLTGQDYDAHLLAMFADRDDDIEALRAQADVVVNLISDADQAHDLFPLAADLVDALRLPIVNHPRKVARTTRESVATSLATLPLCRVPRTLRLMPQTSRDAALEAAASLVAPMLARPAGTHGGDDFEKFDSAAEAAEFVSRNPDAGHYLIEYIDYRSADGYFRKYRFIFVGDDVLPYHLAIGDHWKLHHDSTDMINHDWMQQEEAAFLADPSTAFGEAQQTALHAIRRTIDLEYAGIDCGLDLDGHIVVFEVNASMLVHQRNEQFRYKEPYVERIRVAFDALLTRMAKGESDHDVGSGATLVPEVR